MLQGKSINKVDEKGRFRMPTRLKSELGENLIITLDSSGCLFVLTEELSQSITQKIKDMPISDEEINAYIRAFTSSSYDLIEDSQGRYTLPSDLKREAKIDKDIVIVGAVNKVEIWAQEVWDEMNNKVSAINPMLALKKLGI